MLSEPQAILFETQLGWPPAEIVAFRPTKDFVRGLYNALHETEFNEFVYQNLELQGLSLYSKHEEGGVSRIKFNDGHIAITEENSGTTVEDFVRRVRTVSTALAQVSAKYELGSVPLFTQRCKINCLSQPNEVSPLDLLASRMSVVKEEIEPFGRPPAFFGVRFRFPPVTIVEDDEETIAEELEDYCVVRFETYSDDQSKVWMEVASSRLFKSAVDFSDDGQQIVEAGIRCAYKFLSENCKNFLDQFDKRDSPESGENHGNSNS